MANVIAGLFDSVTDANNFLADIESRGYTADEVSIITQEDAVQIENDATEGVADAAATGGVIGGVLGLLAGVGALTLPGIGALFVSGPIATALGLSGIVGTTATGAVTGALAGGIIGALKELGVDEATAQMYQERIEEGAVMIAVNAKNDGNDIEQLMDENNAEHVITDMIIT